MSVERPQPRAGILFSTLFYSAATGVMFGMWQRSFAAGYCGAMVVYIFVSTVRGWE